LALVGHKGEMPFPLYYDLGHKVGKWRAAEDGWLDGRLRLSHYLWQHWHYDGIEVRERNSRQQSPKGLWDWTEEELREEELGAIERIMETPPVPLSRIGKTHGRHGRSWVRAIAMGGW
jgi:hypothetical protein